MSSSSSIIVSTHPMSTRSSLSLLSYVVSRSLQRRQSQSSLTVPVLVPRDQLSQYLLLLAHELVADVSAHGQALLVARAHVLDQSLNTKDNA